MSPAELRLQEMLDTAGAVYEVIDHEPEGRTDLVSALRGHEVSAAAKCIVLLVKLGKKETRYVLAVVAGDRRVDLAAVKKLLDARYVGFAAVDRAEELAGSPSGTMLPFTFDQRLALIADVNLLDRPRIYFNAARLDRSLALDTVDWLRISQPRIERIAAE